MIFQDLTPILRSKQEMIFQDLTPILTTGPHFAATTVDSHAVGSSGSLAFRITHLRLQTSNHI